ncbi:MAG: right-handed parallel beta-helix repeat-containing protein [Opitutales bacterium]|nr:right-handed parallel beta-helix repeat-containing protein [Opitutales bacterium]
MRAYALFVLCLPALPVFAGSYADLILADSPAAYWRLNEEAGTQAADSAGEAHATYSSGVTRGVPGPPALGEDSRAALFDGSSGSVDTPFAFNPSAGSFTLEAWVRLDAYNGSNSSAILQQDGPLGRTLLKVEGGLREFSSHLGNDVRLSGFPVSIGQWHHLALVFDDAPGQIQWYVDGTPRATESVIPEPETAPLMIGRHKSLSTLHFNGAIAEVAVYPETLSPARIAARADYVPPPQPPPPTFPEVELHVNPAHPSADDSNPGDLAFPLRTLAEAAARAEPGTTVWVHPGTYTDALVLSTSGTSLQPIIFRATERGETRLAPEGTAVSPHPDEPAAHIVLDGFDITDAAPHGHDPALRAGNHWTIRHCRIHGAFKGIVLDATFTHADNVRIERTVIEDCRGNGLVVRGDIPFDQRGPFNLTVEQSILRRCNLDAHGEASTGGAAHFSGTHGVVLRRVISYDNNGPSFRFTWQDTGFLIEDCTVFGNHGSEAWVGAGIWIEMSHGPGTIRRNTVFSNTGAGIAVLEAGNLTLEDNLVADNDSALVLRDDYDPWVGSASGVTRYLRDLTIAANRFHAWRRAALTTWTDDVQTVRSGSPRWIDIDANTYDPAGSPTLVAWFNGLALDNLGLVRNQLGFEDNGTLAPVTLPPGFTAFATNPGTEPQLDPMDGHYAMAADLADAAPGTTVAVPVHGIRMLPEEGADWRMELHDLAAYSTVEARGADTATLEQIAAALSPFPRWQPLFLRGLLSHDEAGEPEVHIEADGRTLLAERRVDISPGEATAARHGAEPAALTLRRKGHSAESFTISLLAQGVAEPDVDYTALPPSVTFPPGVREQQLIIEPLPRKDFPPEQPVLSLHLSDDPGFVSAQESAFVEIVDTPYRQWLRRHFSLGALNDPDAPTGPHDDASGDGQPNLIPFAFALDPTRPLDPKSLPALSREGSSLVFHYTRRTTPAGIHYFAETSANLVDWQPVSTEGHSITTNSTDSETEDVFVDIPPPEPGEARFIRLRIDTDP